MTGIIDPDAKVSGHSREGAARGGRETATTEAIPVDWAGLARAEAHPLRISILEILGIDGGRALSPSDLSMELQAPLANVNYHVTELAKAGLVEVARQRPVRGTVQNFYRLPSRRSPPG